jgi:hypothetical protein
MDRRRRHRMRRHLKYNTFQTPPATHFKNETPLSAHGLLKAWFRTCTASTWRQQTQHRSNEQRKRRRTLQIRLDSTLGGLRLYPCAFGGRMCRGPERYLHSYLGEATTLKVGILKNRHVLYGIPFSNIGDCVGIKWIMLYEGTNAPIM